MDEQEEKQPVEEPKDAAPVKHEEPQAKRDVMPEEDYSSTVFSPGEVINNTYKIEKLIGRGGMGEVYRAKDIELGTDVALKVVSKAFSRDNSHALDMLRNEAKKSASLRHKNIVSVLGLKYEESKGAWYVIMEYIDGGSLHSILDRQNPISEEQAVVIVQEIANALNVAAELKIAHRDIKPDNIMFTSRGEVKLADLGIARHYGSYSWNATKSLSSGFNAGTPEYLAPEQLIDSEYYDIRSDLYSLGVTFYEMITGNVPFEGSMPGLKEQILNNPPPDPRKFNPNVTEWCAQLVLRMLAKNPNDRFSSPKELIEAIDAGPYMFNILQREEMVRNLVAGEHATVIDSKTSWSSSKYSKAEGSSLVFKISMGVMVFSMAVLLGFGTLMFWDWNNQENIPEGLDIVDVFKIDLSNDTDVVRRLVVNLLDDGSERLGKLVNNESTADSEKVEKSPEDYKKTIDEARETQKRLVKQFERLERLSKGNPRLRDEVEYRLKSISDELDVALDVHDNVSEIVRIYESFGKGDTQAQDALKDMSWISFEMESEVDSNVKECPSGAEKIRLLVAKVKDVQNSLEKIVRGTEDTALVENDREEQEKVENDREEQEKVENDREEQEKVENDREEQEKVENDREDKVENEKTELLTDFKETVITLLEMVNLDSIIKAKDRSSLQNQYETVKNALDEILEKHNALKIELSPEDKAEVDKLLKTRGQLATVAENTTIIRGSYLKAHELYGGFKDVLEVSEINKMCVAVSEDRKNAEDALSKLSSSGYDSARLVPLEDEAKAQIAHLKQWERLLSITYFMKKAKALLAETRTRTGEMVKANHVTPLGNEFNAAKKALNEIKSLSDSLKIELTSDEKAEIERLSEEGKRLDKEIACVQKIVWDYLTTSEIYVNIKMISRIDNRYKHGSTTITECRSDAEKNLQNMSMGAWRRELEPQVAKIAQMESFILNKPLVLLMEKTEKLLKEAKAEEAALAKADEGIFSKGRFELDKVPIKEAHETIKGLEKEIGGIRKTLASKDFVPTPEKKAEVDKLMKECEQQMEKLEKDANGFEDKLKADLNNFKAKVVAVGKQSFQWIDDDMKAKAITRMEQAFEFMDKAVASQNIDGKWLQKRLEVMGIQQLLEVMSLEDLTLAGKLNDVRKINDLLRNDLKSTNFCTALDALAAEIDKGNDGGRAELLNGIMGNLSAFKDNLERVNNANFTRNGADERERRYKGIREKLEMIEGKLKK